MDEPLLKSFDLIARMIGGENGAKGGGIRRGVEETKFVSGEEGGCIMLFPIPGRGNGMCRAERIVLVITGGMRSSLGAIGSERRPEFW